MLKHIHRKIMHIFSTIWSLFLSGLFTILPITLTIVIFSITFKLIKGWLEPLHRLNLPILNWIPHFEIVIVLIMIFIIGALVQIFILRTLIEHIESYIAHLPLVRTVYGGIKQLVKAFSSQDKVTFKQVIMIEFPLENVYSIGFLTAETPHILAPESGIKYFNVFVPTTPNPTTGFFVLVPEHKIKITQLTRQEAMSMVISGGIICPDRFTEHPAKR